LPIVVEEEKHGNSASIQAECFLGGAMPVAPLMPFEKERMVHNSRFWRVERSNTRIFRYCSPGNTPQGRRLFLCYFLRDATLPKVVEWLPVPSSVVIAETMGNTVMFLQEALRLLTRTFFSFQGTTQLFFLHLQKEETQGLKPRVPTHGLKCRGLRRLKPYAVDKICNLLHFTCYISHMSTVLQE
jgi:hypothetical protein